VPDDPDPPQHPSVYACHGQSWAINRTSAGGWVAQRLTADGNTMQIISATTEAELIISLDVIEAAAEAEAGS
jgi:hypothetical protein